MIRDMMDSNEYQLWEGKPEKITYIIGNPVMYVVALVWGAFDFAFIGMMFGLGGGLPMGFGLFMIPFFLLHLMPVWIAVGGPIYRAINWNYIHYVLTDKRIYIQSGIIGRDINVVEFMAISEPEVNVGLIEKLRGCGTIRLTPSVYRDRQGNQRTTNKGALLHIEDPYNVYKRIKQMSVDIKSDIHYPNALRPEENPGYNTKYDPN
jgi:hypothetical protein